MRTETRAALLTALALAMLSVQAQGHEQRHCHAHLFEDGTPADQRHSKAIPGCILQGNRMYVPSECYVPRPSAQCVTLMKRAADYQHEAREHRAERDRRWREEMKEQTEAGKGRVRRLYD